MRRRVLRGALLMLLVSGLYGLFLWTIPLPRTWVSLSATSEFVAFRVTNSNMATFRVAGMRGASVDGRVAGCIDGVLVPAPGARVEYRRGEDDFFRITVDPPAAGTRALTLRDKGKNFSPIDLSSSLVIAADEGCAGKAPQRLPIWGLAEFGEEQRPASTSGDLVPGLLLEGTVSVFAHAHDRLLGIRFPATVYPVNTFDVPAGSVLLSGDPADDDALWTGTATASSERGFSVKASSNAQSVQLRSVRGLNTPAGDGRTIDLGKYSQFLSDPNIVQVQFVVGAFVFLLQSLLSILGFFDLDPSSARDEGDEP